MSDSRFYSLLIVLTAGLGIGAIVVLDITQPESLNVTLLEKVMTILTVVLPVLIGRLGATKEAAVVAEKADAAKVVAEATQHDVAVNTAITTELAHNVERAVSS